VRFEGALVLAEQENRSALLSGLIVFGEIRLRRHSPLLFAWTRMLSSQRGVLDLADIASLHNPDGRQAGGRQVKNRRARAALGRWSFHLGPGECSAMRAASDHATSQSQVAAKAIAKVFGSLAECPGRAQSRVSQVVNFQVAVLKVLASYPNGLAALPDIKRDLAFLATSGSDWANYSRRLGAAFPSLDIFSGGFVQRYSFGWRLTAKGAIALEMMEEGVRFPVIAPKVAQIQVALAQPAEIESSEERAQAAASSKDRRQLFAAIDGGRSKAA
jgi:hypothetical protein